MKTNTSRFPIKQIKEACGPTSGDWVTFISEVKAGNGYLPIWAVGHRRGDECHCFLMSCGTSLAGKPMHYQDAFDSDGLSVGRRIPKGLNDYSEAQPIIDRANRYRQDILDIEHRFKTNNFDFRFYTDFLAIIFCNTIEAFNYFHEGGKGGFLASARKLSYQLMHNTWDVDHAPRVAGERRPREEETASPENSPRKSARQCEQHTLIRLSTLEGYEGKRQIKCGECGQDCGFCCLQCSTKDRVVAVHPPTTKHNKKLIHHPCLAAHRRSPALTRVVRPTGSAQKAPRPRGRPNRGS